MKFKTYYSLLLKEATREEVKKYYPKINDEDFNTILDGDKTGTKDKVGNLSRLTLDLYKKDKFNIKSEVLRDVYAAFELVQKKKHLLANTEFAEFSNLSAIPSVKALMSANYYLSQLNSGKIKLKATDGQNVEIFYEDENWVVKVPLDYMASVRIGRSVKAEWCTASSKAMYHYNRYVAQDDLYIFINKHTNEAYQYFDSHGDVEFNDIKNEPVGLNKFVNKNKLESALRKIQAESEKIQGDKNYHSRRLLKRYEQTKSPYIVLLAMKGNDSLLSKLLKTHNPNLDDKFLLSTEEDGTETYSTLNVELFLFKPKFSTLVYNKDAIEEICRKLKIEKYTINSDLTVNVEGDVEFYDHFWRDLEDEENPTNIEKLPLNFKQIEGDFECDGLGLTSLKGAPEKVSGNFNCKTNPLKSLEGAPHEVGGNFTCNGCELISLKGAPREVGGDFNCKQNVLKSLEGSPEKVGGNFDCSESKLTSLKGAPREVGGDFRCHSNTSKFKKEEVAKLCNVKGGIETLNAREIKAIQTSSALEKINALDGKEKVVALCEYYKITNYSVGSDLTVDVKGDIKVVRDRLFEKLPLKFKTVAGNFEFYDCGFNSLEGVPETVGGDFVFTNGKFKTLEGSPKSVGGDFDCDRGNLTSLKGAPKSIGGVFNCSYNDLESLAGAPEVVGGFRCENNKLTSLKGAPRIVNGNFLCKNNKLKSLEGSPEVIKGHFAFGCCEMETLRGAPNEIGGSYDCDATDITSLEGAPTKIGGDFICWNNDKLKSLEGFPKTVGGYVKFYDCLIKPKAKDIEKICDVKEKIYVG